MLTTCRHTLPRRVARPTRGRGQIRERTRRDGDMAPLSENVGLIAAVTGVVVAQALKPCTHFVASGGRFRPALAVSSGGFPSSHSAFVTALATGVGAHNGLGDGAFACCVVVAMVVMYDAMGVRRQAGFHASAINSLVAGVYGTQSGSSSGLGAANLDVGNHPATDVESEGGTPRADTLTDTLFDEGFEAFVRRLQERPLREHIGHTPVQVVAGAVTGVVIGIVIGLSMGEV